MHPDISGQKSLFLWAKCKIPDVADRQWGREMPTRRPYETNLFSSLKSTITNINS